MAIHADEKTRKSEKRTRDLIWTSALLAMVALPISVPLIQVAFLADKEAGVQGHSLGLRNPLAFVGPTLLLLAAIIIGVCATASSRRAGGPWTKRAVTMVFALSLALGLHFLAWQRVGRCTRVYAGGGGGNPRCVSNLMQIGHCIQLYRTEHGGQMPGNLRDILSARNMPPAVFICAWDDSPATDAQTGLGSSFVYVAERLTNPPAPEEIVMYERAGIHDKRGANVLLSNGSVEYVTDLEVALAAVSRPASCPTEAKGLK